MDGRRFDDATRALATGVSRRSVLRGLIGGALGGMLALANNHDGLAAPRCKRLGKRCHTTADCCPEQNGAYCAADRTCQACAAGTTLCRGSCVAECGAGTVMDATTCGCVCPSGATACDGACVDTAFDEQHCGGCGQSCTVPGSICANGQCVCPLGTTYCNGACVADACAVAGQSFSPLMCQCECPAGSVACGGECVSTACELDGTVFDTIACQCVCSPAATCGQECCTSQQACCGDDVVCVGPDFEPEVGVCCNRPGQPCQHWTDCCPSGSFNQRFCLEGVCGCGDGDPTCEPSVTAAA